MVFVERFTSETAANGVSERLCTLDDIPGVPWSHHRSAGSLCVLKITSMQVKRPVGIRG